MTAPHLEVHSGPSTLSDAHRDELERGSGIHPGIIAERGYRTTTADNLPSQFPDYQRKDGLLIPIHSVWGTVAALQVKPDKPRIRNSMPIKYETLPGNALCLDVPKRVLPHLGNPEIPLWITEGAKKVDAALTMGVEAVIGLQGVYGWRGTNGSGGKTALPDWEAIALNGRPVILAFDSDCMTKPEVRGALDRLAAFLEKRGAEVCYCLMPPLDDGSKCGIDDFLVQGKTFHDLCDQIVLELPPHDPNAEVLEFVKASEIVSEQMDWIWKGWIPRRMLTILGGFGGDGKSTMMTSLIGSLTTGKPMPDGETVPPMNVLMLSAEDDAAYAIRPRLVANGADPSRIFLLDPDTRMRPDLHRDGDWIRDIIFRHEIGLVVIDPLASILRRSDRASEGDIRDELEPLMRIIEHTGVAVVGVMRVGKGGSVRRPAQSLVGSSVFPAIARSVIMIARDRSADTLPGARVLEVVKGNYVDPPNPISLTMDASGAVQWHGPLTNTIDELAAMGDDPRLSRSEREEAAIFLKEVLADGPVNARIVMEKAFAAGFSEITVRRAKKDASIGSHRVSRTKGLWRWCLPGDEDKVQDVEASTGGTRPQLSDAERLIAFRQASELYKQWQEETAEREAAGIPTRDYLEYREEMLSQVDPGAPEPDAAP